MVSTEEKRPVLSGPDEISTEQNFSVTGIGRKKKVVLFTIGFSQFCCYICFALFAPFFPYEAAKKGASQTVVGLVFGGFQLVIFVSSLFYGNFVAQIGAKFMIVSGLFTTGICTILFGILDMCPDGVVYIVMLFVTRTFEALGTSATLTASFALVANEFPTSLARVIGIVETFVGVGLMVGPPVGGVLYELGGYELPFFVMGGLLIICSLVAYLLLPPKKESTVPFQGSVLIFLRNPLALVTWFASFSLFFTLGFIDPTLAQHLSKFKLRIVFIGLIFLIAPLVFAIASPFWGWFGDAKGYDRSVIVVSCIVAGIAFSVLGPAPFLSFIPFKLYVVMIALFVFGLFAAAGIVMPFKVFKTSASQLGLPDTLDTYGKISGFLSSSFSLGAFFGPTLAGIMTERIGFPWASSVCSFLLIAAGLIMWIHIILGQCLRRKHNQGYKKVDKSEFLLG